MEKFIESSVIEYKRQLTDNLEKSAVAFLNSKEGGQFFLGIDERQQSVYGIDKPDQVQLEIKDRLKNNIEPSIMGLFDIHIETMDDKHVIKITSSGGLPYGLDSEDFFKGHSAPRNKEMMRIFRDLEIVEQLGSGIPRIIDAYGKDCFELSRNFIRVTFPYAESLQKLEQQPEAQYQSSTSHSTSPKQDLKRRYYLFFERERAFHFSSLSKDRAGPCIWAFKTYASGVTA